MEMLLKVLEVWFADRVPGEQVAIFLGSRIGAAGVFEELCTRQVGATLFHGGLAKDEQMRSLEDFHGKPGKVLVATDAVLCEIEATGPIFVINYDMPRDIEIYRQRVGAGHGPCCALTFVEVEREGRIREDPAVFSQLPDALAESGSDVPRWLVRKPPWPSARESTVRS